MKIIHVDRGLVPFELYDYQVEMIRSYYENRFNITMTSRQSGKSTTVIAFILWMLLFNVNYAACISANKQKTAADLLGRLKLAYENLPRFLQQGVTQWAKLEIELENGSKCFAAATSSSAVRGGSYACVSGSSDITLRLNREVYTLPIAVARDLIANSSKSSKCLNRYEDAFVADMNYDLFRQQVRALVLPVDGQTTTDSGNVVRKVQHQSTSCDPTMLGGSQGRGASDTDDPRTLDRASSPDPHGRRLATAEVADVCVYAYARGASGPYGEFVRQSSSVLYREAVTTSARPYDGPAGNEGNATEVVTYQYGSDIDSGASEEDQPGEDGAVCWTQSERRDQASYVRGTTGQEKDSGACRQDQPQPRKNSQDGGKASRYETNSRNL